MRVPGVLLADTVTFRTYSCCSVSDGSCLPPQTLEGGSEVGGGCAVGWLGHGRASEEVTAEFRPG